MDIVDISLLAAPITVSVAVIRSRKEFKFLLHHASTATAKFPYQDVVLTTENKGRVKLTHISFKTIIYAGKYYTLDIKVMLFLVCTL